ncbi:MAG: pca operon transcription factor PcaQ [Pseudomonadota bacterium]
MESIDGTLAGRIKLRHIRCFAEIARARSLAGAAERLALSQPTVSKTLAELETILGARLVTRSRRGAELTHAGAGLLPRVAAALTELERGLEGLRGAAGRERLRVGVLPTVAASIAPQAIRRFHAERPEVVVTLVTGPNLYLVERLRAGGLDLVVGRLAVPDKMKGLAFQHLYSELVRAVVRPGHPLVAAAPGGATLWLGDFPLVLPDRDAVIRPAVDRLLITLGVGEPMRRIESVSNAFGRNFVRDTDAIWLISEGVVARDLADGTLARLEIDTAETLGPVGLTTRAGGEGEPAVALRHFMRIIETVSESR